MRTPIFVRDPAELETVQRPGSPCPHCGRCGTLVGHGLLRGYDPLGSDRVLRGRKLLCSNRHRRPGCGQTVAVLLANVLRRRVANTASLSVLWRALADGRSPSGVDEAGLTRRSRCRLLEALRAAQHRVRTWALGMAPAPASTDSNPLVQLWHHLLAVVGEASNPLAELQLRTQHPLLG